MSFTMPRSCFFSYGISFHESGRVTTFPAAYVNIQDQKGEWASFVLLIDSGATISALPAADASLLGVDAKRGERIAIIGIGGKPVRGWRHELRARLGENQITLPLVFLDDPQSPRVLGRTNIFEQFTVVFEERKHRTGLIGERTQEEKEIRSVLDRIGGSK